MGTDDLFKKRRKEDKGEVSSKILKQILFLS